VAEESGDKEEGGQEEAAVKKKDDVVLGSPAGMSPKLVFGVLALNAVIVAAVAALLFLNYKKSQSAVSLQDIATSHEGSAKAGGDHGGDSHGAGDKKKDEAPKNFIKQSFRVNLANGNHFAVVDVDIEVDDDFVREELNRIEPKVRDFIIIVLSSKTYEQIDNVEGRDFLREEIKNKINSYLTKGQVKNVFFTQFIIQ